MKASFSKLRATSPETMARSIFGIIGTFVAIHFIESSLATLLALLPFWYLLFRPLHKVEKLIFFIASVFFLVQNYTVLKAGGFSFREQDILLQPYYEPFLWGFYFLTIKRFVGEGSSTQKLQWRALAGLLLTGFCFSFFSQNSNLLMASTTLSTAVLLTMFHERYDIVYALCALILGFIVELFGVSTGLWSYPEPDFLGMPFWFSTMWLSVGILGRRFLIPLAEWIGRQSLPP